VLTINDIKEKKFEKSAFGYKMEDVENFLNEVIDLVVDLQEENADAQKKLMVLAEKIEEYRNEEDSLRQALLGAQKLADNILKDAKNRAEIIMRDATIKSEQAVKNVKDDVKKEEIILNKMKREVDAFRTKMLTMYSSHIDMIKSIPEIDRAKEEEIAKEVVAEAEPEVAPVVEVAEEVKPTPAIENAKEEPAEEVKEVIVEAKEETEKEPEISGGFQFIRFDDAGDFKVKSDSNGESKFGKLKFGDDYDLNGDKK